MAKKDAKHTAQQILAAVGGKENITAVLHCATRLRLSLKDDEKIDVEAIKQADDVAGYFFKSGQHQIILGTGFVNRVYDVVASECGGSDAPATAQKVEIKSFNTIP